MRPCFKDPEDFIVVRAGNSARVKICYEVWISIKADMYCWASLRGYESKIYLYKWVLLFRFYPPIPYNILEWCVYYSATWLHIPHTWSNLSDIDISRLNLHLRSVGWRMMSQYPRGFILSILKECLSSLFPHQSAQIQPFTPSKPKTLWVRLHLILRSESQVRTKNRGLHQD